jgi:hypothetical protein
MNRITIPDITLPVHTLTFEGSVDGNVAVKVDIVVLFFVVDFDFYHPTGLPVLSPI